MENTIKFIYIALCFFVSVSAIGLCHSKRDYILLITGMFFTMLSDFSLLVLNNQFLGVSTFCFVHIAYITRLKPDKNLRYVFSGFILFAITGMFLKPLYAIAITYAYLFFIHLLLAFSTYRRVKYPLLTRKLILYGTILFVLCDINVMFYNAPSVVAINNSLVENILEYVLLLIWGFYVPAQLMLALSGFAWGGAKGGIDNEA